MFKKICTKLTTDYSFPVIGFWIIAFFFSSLHFITIPFHSRAPASSRGTAPTRARLLSSISCCFLFVLFGEEVIRLMIIREQHSLFFHQKVIISNVITVLLGTPCSLLQKTKWKSMRTAHLWSFRDLHCAQFYVRLSPHSNEWGNTGMVTSGLFYPF